MHPARHVSLTATIATADKQVCPLTGRHVAALRILLPPTQNESADPDLVWLGRAIVVRSNRGGIRVALPSVRVLCGPRHVISSSVPSPASLPVLQPFAGRPCEVIHLHCGDLIALASPIRLAKCHDDGPDWVWETCAAPGQAVLTVP